MRELANVEDHNLHNLQIFTTYLSIKGEPNGIQEPDWLSSTQPFYAERIVFGQLIRPKNATNFFDLAQNFDLGPQIIFSYLSMLVVLLLVCIALKTVYGRLCCRLSRRLSYQLSNQLSYELSYRLSNQLCGQLNGNQENRKLGARQSFSSKLNQFLTFLRAASSLPSFAVLFLFFNLFAWFTMLFFSSNIKTKTVVLGG